jgi:uncharacterized membrane protein YgdD (TMEM256/DUF423 family)
MLTAERLARIGAVSGAIAVAAGAFGAHALRTRLDPADLVVFETAARYQMYHSLALLATAWLLDRRPTAAAVLAGWLFIEGIVVFSGSLYALTLTGARWLGAITPLGGIGLIAGWIALAVAASALTPTPGGRTP